jgi:hypothetical protein
MEVKKSALYIGLASLVVAIGAAGCLYNFPDATAKAGRALISQNIQIKPTKNGLAEIHVSEDSNKKTPGGVGAAAGAGDRMQMQLNLESAAK